MKVLLAGSTTYANRGCEAIVRGTVAILRRRFGAEVQFVAASFGAPQDLNGRLRPETDPFIRHIRLGYDRISIPSLLNQCNRRLHMRTPGRYWALHRAMKGAAFSLQVGGDNYSLDYGVPTEYLQLDDYLLQQGLPTFLWGASVGPFAADPEFAKLAHQHLNKLQGVFVRETLSLEYLRQHGVSARVTLVADPAFAMEPEEPSPELVPDILPRHPIGLNFSPMMARYATGGDVDAWRRICIETVIGLMRRAGEGLLFVPHVFQPWFDNDDSSFLAAISDAVYRDTRTSISVASQELSAAQLKWVIARCTAFVGARTHSTIASLSTSVPTLSLAYSVKARGLNQDMLGNLDYCIHDSADLTSETMVARTLQLLNDGSRLRDHLTARLPDVKARAYAAGDYLAAYLERRETP
jgi:colanic acid/amylovoran biosynthesis protein